MKRNRRQAIIWTKAGLVWWHIYAPLDLEGLVVVLEVFVLILLLMMLLADKSIEHWICAACDPFPMRLITMANALCSDWYGVKVCNTNDRDLRHPPKTYSNSISTLSNPLNTYEFTGENYASVYLVVIDSDNSLSHVRCADLKSGL